MKKVRSVHYIMAMNYRGYTVLHLPRDEGVVQLEIMARCMGMRVPMESAKASILNRASRVDSSSHLLPGEEPHATSSGRCTENTKALIYVYVTELTSRCMDDVSSCMQGQRQRYQRLDIYINHTLIALFIPAPSSPPRASQARHSDA